MTTKIYALVDALGNPVEAMLSPGQDHDLTCAQPLIEAVDPGALIADKAFDADAFIAVLDDRAIVPVIPSKSNRKTPRRSDFALYRERNLVERFFNKRFAGSAIVRRSETIKSAPLASPNERSIRHAARPPYEALGRSLSLGTQSRPWFDVESVEIAGRRGSVRP